MAIDFRAKAQSLLDAYQAKFGFTPSKNECLLVMSVALHETALGEAWNRSHNWGAIQRPGNHTSPPTPRDAFEASHGDSSPITGRYSTFFWAFPDGLPCPAAGGLSGDAAGAWMLLDVLCIQHPTIRPVLSTGNVWQLAFKMYVCGYYEGIHDPRIQPGESRFADGMTPGQESNIRDYSTALAQALGQLTAALVNWDPLGPPPDAFDLSTVVGLQNALNALQVVTPALLADGVNGPKTTLAVKAFQAKQGLKIDGVAGPATRTALLVALKNAGVLT